MRMLHLTDRSEKALIHSDLNTPGKASGLTLVLVATWGKVVVISGFLAEKFRDVYARVNEDSVV